MSNEFFREFAPRLCNWVAANSDTNLDNAESKPDNFR